MNYETVLLKTNRLIIKKGEINDFLKVYEYDFSRLKNVDGECKLVKQDLSKIEAWFKGGINKYYSKIKKGHMFDWIIYADNIPTGNILTEGENLDTKTVFVSYNMHPSYWNKGYMTEALEKVIEFLFSIGYDNVICKYSDGNIRSKRVMEKLGFKPFMIEQDSWKNEKGNLVDDYVMIMTKDDFLSKTARLKVIKDSL